MLEASLAVAVPDLLTIRAVLWLVVPAEAAVEMLPGAWVEEAPPSRPLAHLRPS